MTTKEFTFWIEGYISAGGYDVKVIQEKLATVKDIEPSLIPYVIPYYPYEPYYIKPFYDYAYVTCNVE